MFQIMDNVMDLRYSCRQKVSATPFSYEKPFCCSNIGLDFKTVGYNIISPTTLTESKMLLLTLYLSKLLV